jgi:hypothetical protein
MQLFINRPVVILLLVGLLSALVARGIVPALTRVDSDFPNYFTAARIVADGGHVERLYDTVWFQQQMRLYKIGNAEEGEFIPFPPPTALLLVPLSRLAPLDALRVVTCVSLVCLVASIVLLARILTWTLLESTVFILLSGYAVLNTLRFGQPYIVVSLSCILGYYAHRRGRAFLAGICFGFFAPIKYFPVILLAYFAFRRDWKVVLGGAAAIFTVALTSIALLGWNIHAQFIATVLGDHLTARLNLQDPFTASYQSFDSLFRRLLIFDATANPQPLFAAPRLYGAAVVAVKASIFLAAMATLVKLARDGVGAAPCIGILGILTMLLAPATATYHFALLWLPVGLLIGYFLDERAPRFAYFTLIAYALIGFFPYRFTVPFEGRGGLTVLAYPRLLILLAMFAACVQFIWTRAAPGSEAEK